MKCNSPYCSKAKKVSYIERLFDRYCSLKNNSESENIRNKICEILVKPSMLANDTGDYYECLSDVWDKFDKIPHRAMVIGSDRDYDYFKIFKQKVIIPIGLNPDKY